MMHVSHSLLEAPPISEQPSLTMMRRIRDRTEMHFARWAKMQHTHDSHRNFFARGFDYPFDRGSSRVAHAVMPYVTGDTMPET